MKILGMLLFAGVTLSTCIDYCTKCQENECFGCNKRRSRKASTPIKIAGLSIIGVVCLVSEGAFTLLGVICLLLSAYLTVHPHS